MADIKIPFKYCRIERAAELLNCKIEDLLTLGFDNKININVMFDSDISFLFMEGNIDEAEQWKANLLPSNYCYGGASAISEYSSFKFDNLSVDENDNPIWSPYFQESNGLVFSCEGRAYGLWRLIRNLDDLINYRVAYVGECSFIPCYPPENNRAMQLNSGGFGNESLEPESSIDEYEVEERSIRITDKDLWITAPDIRKLLNCNGDYYLIDDLDSVYKMPQKETKLQNIHPTKNRHAVNREQILIAAIKFKEQQPNVFRENCIKTDNSINYTEFARQLLARPSFFPNGDCPMKTTEAIIKVLKNAF